MKVEEPVVTVLELSNSMNGNHSEDDRNSSSEMEAEISLTVIPQSDDDDGGLSSECSTHSQDDYHEHTDIISAAMEDDVTAHLASAGWSKQHLHGTLGLATATAIVSGRKRKRPHAFESNPSMRKRQHNRLLRKLRQTIDEFSTRVGQQAVVLVATPGKEISGFRCFGAKPLEDVLKNLKSMIMDELETALAQHAPSPIPHDPSLYELPPLILDGTPTPVERMTQAQLRAFIPLMLKYSTGRGKPGWGRESTKPPWWPSGLPWANVRMDARTDQDKQKVSWTKALRQIVINCYKYHGREDLLPVLSEDEDSKMTDSPDNSMANACCATTTTTSAVSQYTSSVLQTINNSDGTVSIIHVDPNNPIITMPDGTQAHVQGVATLHTSQGENGPTVHSLQSLAEVATSQSDNVTSVDLLNNVTEATLNQSGQIILTGEDGHGYPVSISGMLTVPVSASMYQTVVANIQHINNDGTMQVTPVVHVPKIEPGSANMENNLRNNEVETITVTPHQVITMGGSADSQVLQVISIKDPNAIKALTAVSVSDDMKVEEAPTIIGE